MSRTTWSMTDEAAQSLEDAASREDGESATDFILRVAEIVSETNNGTTVMEPLRSGSEGDGCGCECNVPEDVLTEDHLDDIQNIVDRRVERLESNLRP